MALTVCCCDADVALATKEIETHKTFYILTKVNTLSNNNKTTPHNEENQDTVEKFSHEEAQLAPIYNTVQNGFDFHTNDNFNISALILHMHRVFSIIMNLTLIDVFCFLLAIFKDISWNDMSGNKLSVVS